MNYQQTKIYKIESHCGDKIYIGSTAKQYLSQRMEKHRSEYKEWKKGLKKSKIMSYVLFDDYGVENCFITLLEAYPCNSRDEAHAREAYYIKAHDCVNKVIPQRTQAEYKADNKEKIKEYQKEYNPKYYEENKDAISLYKKTWLLENNDRVKEYRNAPYACTCGVSTTLRNKARHEKSKHHLSSL